MGHIGDMYPNLPVASGKSLQGQCIVEIAGIGRINGEGDHIAEIATAFNIFLCYFIAYLFSIPFNFLSEAIGKLIFGKDGMHLSLMLTRPAKHLSYLCYRIP